MNLQDTRNWQVYINDPSVTVEGAEDIAQCVYVILNTIQGSDPLRPDFGSEIYKYLDKPINDYIPYMILAATRAIEKWEKRIKLTKCVMETTGMDSKRLVIEAEMTSSAAEITVKVNI